MSSLQKVGEYLRMYAGQQYCDDCLSAALQIKPRQQVQQKTAKLATISGYRRAPGICCRCRANRLVIEATCQNVASTVVVSEGELPPARRSGPLKPRNDSETARLTPDESQYVQAIEAKDRQLRTHLGRYALTEPIDVRQWLSYLSDIKRILGNTSNDLSFVSTLLVKEFLAARFAITDFDAGGKAQGAPGIDVEARTADGKLVVGELKTTTPYQPGFGAKQRENIAKDLRKLASSSADHRFMFVIDPDTFRALRNRKLASLAPGIEVVDLVSGQDFTYPTA